MGRVHIMPTCVSLFLIQMLLLILITKMENFHFLFRYIFETKDKCGLQEIGPRFTLKLMWLKNGIFNSRSGNYIYKYKVS